ncbi:MAG: UxaA family hydrolase [Rhodospirillales bacterium]
MVDFIRLSESDNVITVTKPLPADRELENVRTVELIPSGHKVAAEGIAKGASVRKYAQIIGRAARDIAPGEHVHTDEIEFHSTSRDYEYSTDLRHPVMVPESGRDVFKGYRRANGSTGTRNYIAVLTSVNCSATAARKIASAFGPEELAAYPNVDGVAAFVHGTGCGMAADGDGFAALQRVMWGYARHPNHAGVLMVGLGCETNQIDWLLEAYGIEKGPLFQVMNIQSVSGLQKTIETGIEYIRAMLPEADKCAREPCPASELTVALQCGGSDAWSGVTANPAVGRACDILVAQGGACVLAETPEIYGAEHLLTRRAVSREVGEQLIERIRWWEDYTERNKVSMNNNPSPGNKKGGLTTILEKSLGAAAKGGVTPLMGVYRYAETVRTKGLNFMDTPGYDPASVTGEIAGGCNLVCFTTGRGSTFGSKPAPTVKVATNTEMYKRMTGDMDVNAGTMLSDGILLEEKGREIYELWLRTASGEKSKSEAQGLGDYEFVPWQIGAVM